MSTYTQKVEAFDIAIANGHYEVDDQFADFLHECLKTAGFNNIPIQPVQTIQLKQNKTRQLTGYNLFMSAEMPNLKDQGVPAGDRMRTIGVMWMSLGDTDKQIWKDKADQTAPVQIAIKPKGKSGPRKLTGYQYFLQRTMPEVKIDESVIPKDRMSAIAKKWGVLTNDQKAEWKINAASH